MTPYLDGHDDLSAAVFVSLVGFWELDKDEVPPEYFEVHTVTELHCQTQSDGFHAKKKRTKCSWYFGLFQPIADGLDYW